MSKTRYILALDQGTTSSRAIVFDRHGGAVSSAQKEFPQIYPQPGWVEHDPLAIWSSQNATAIEAISKANLSTDAIATVGVANQRETTIVWDRETGQPVYNAIVWQDRRTADYCAKLKREGAEPMVRRQNRAAHRSLFFGHQDSLDFSKMCRARERGPRQASCGSAPWTPGCCGS